MMQEDLLQFIWQHRLLKPVSLFTDTGQRLQVVNPGILNRQSGPDFFNGQIRLEDLLLSGNIEIHVRSSDWLKHGHQQDAAYDRLILHVVYEHDVKLSQNERFAVPVLELKNYVDSEVLVKYSHLYNTSDKLPCASSLGNVNDITFRSLLERLGVERLQLKIARVEKLLKHCHGNYHEVLYRLLLGSFGCKINTLPFELIAEHLPVQVLLRHADHLLHAEALLLGTAGLLHENFEDKWMRALQNEYLFMSRKYKLRSLDASLLKTSGLRPANFPALRLAQLAAVFYKHPEVLYSVLEFKKPEVLKKILRSELSPYWQQHYTCTGVRSKSSHTLGDSAAESIIINSFVPFYFFYGKKFGKEEYCELAINLLNECAAEQNSRIRMFKAKNQQICTAYDSQGILQLYDHYCSQKQCLKCSIGYEIMRLNREKNATAEALR